MRLYTRSESCAVVREARTGILDGWPCGFEVGAGIRSGGRRGALHLPYGEVQTPVFMPVGTAATVKAVPQETLEQIGADGAGAEMILAQHLSPDPAARPRTDPAHGRPAPLHELEQAAADRLRCFQVFSLAKLRKVTDGGVEFRSHLDGSLHSSRRSTQWRCRLPWART